MHLFYFYKHFHYNVYLSGELPMLKSTGILALFVNGKKSWEGSLAMLLVSLITGVCLLCLHFGYPASISIICALSMAVSGTLAELLSPSEWDTVTVPVTMLIFALLIL